MTLLTLFILVVLTLAWIGCVGCYTRQRDLSELLFNGKGAWGTMLALGAGSLALIGALGVNLGIGVLWAEHGATPVLVASAVGEELLKTTSALGVLVLLQRWNRHIGPIACAALVGLGFAVAEAVLYISQFGSEVVWVRMLWTAPAHMAYTVICVSGVLAWRHGGGVWLMGGLLLGCAAHAGTNLLMMQNAALPAMVALAVFASSVGGAHLLLRYRPLRSEPPVPASA